MIKTILRNRLVFGPPRFSIAIKPFVQHKHVFKLAALVDEYLPGERASVVNHAEPAKAFARQFSKKYFPIKEGDGGYWGQNVIEWITGAIPVEMRGMGRWEYEVVSDRFSVSQLLAETLCVCPFVGREDRVAVVERFIKTAKDKADAIMKLIPEHGCTLAEIEAALKDSAWPGLLTRCRWIFHETGNAWLDNPAGDRVAWNRQIVLQLAKDWKNAQQLENEMGHFDVWLKKDFSARSLEVARFISQHRPRLLVEVLA